MSLKVFLPSTFMFLLVFFVLPDAAAQKIIHEKRSLVTNVQPRDRGVAGATVYIDYVVRRMGEEVMFSISYADVRIDANAGYYYQGKKYGAEVPGLLDLLKNTKATFPKVHFDIYYGTNREHSFSYSLSAKNDLSVLTGDTKSFKTTREKLDKPSWRLVANYLETFNYSPDLTIWLAIEDRIVQYENDLKEKTAYQDIIREADKLFAAKTYEEAQRLYYKASQNRKADSYPATQMGKIKGILKKSTDKERFEYLMSMGRSSESGEDLRQALSFYNLAAEMGFDQITAKRAADRVEQEIQNQKAAQERILEKRVQAEKEAQANAELQQQKNQQEAERVLKEKQKELERLNEEKLEKIKAEMEKGEQQKLEAERKKKLEEEAAARQKNRLQEEQRQQQEKQGRRAEDEKDIKRYERKMAFDPQLFQRNVDSASKYFDMANSIKPYEALELKSEWWNMNHYMEEFREGLNEPKRQQAWQKSQQLLQQQEMLFYRSKEYYKEAIQYTDKNSRQYQYLIVRIDGINKSIDFQKQKIKISMEAERERQQSYETAQVYEKINRSKDNRARAAQIYRSETYNNSYPTTGSKVTNSGNPAQRQYDYEQRLNRADGQLSMANAVTGTSTQLAVGLMTSDKSAALYENHTMGVNFFVGIGYANYPIIANEDHVEGYVDKSIIETAMVAPVSISLTWWINRSKNWDVGIKGDLSLGLLPILGYNAFLFESGGTFMFNAGFNRVKLAIEGDLHTRSLSYTYDRDVAGSDDFIPVTTASNIIERGKANYSVLKVGAGFHFNTSDKYDDSHIRLMLYAEKPSFYQNFNMMRPVLSGAGEVMFRGGMTIGFTYSQNYPAAGEAKYSVYEYKTRDYWRLSVGKTWTLGIN